MDVGGGMERHRRPPLAANPPRLGQPREHLLLHLQAIEPDVLVRDTEAQDHEVAYRVVGVGWSLHVQILGEGLDLQQDALGRQQALGVGQEGVRSMARRSRDGGHIGAAHGMRPDGIPNGCRVRQGRIGRGHRCRCAFGVRDGSQTKKGPRLNDGIFERHECDQGCDDITA